MPERPPRARITDGQVDLLVNRLEYYWGRGNLDISCAQMSAVLCAMFPKQYGGNAIAVLHRIGQMKACGQLTMLPDSESDAYDEV